MTSEEPRQNGLGTGMPLQFSAGGHETGVGTTTVLPTAPVGPKSCNGNHNAYADWTLDKSINTTSAIACNCFINQPF